MPLYAAVHNPYFATPELKKKLNRATQAQIDQFTNDRKARGYDSVVLTHPDGTIELVVFDRNAVKSLDNSGGFSPTGDIHFSRSANSSTSNAAPGARTANSSTPFRDRMDKIVDSLIYNFQDRFKPLKDIQKRAGLVPENEDAALAEERYSGMVRARTDDFEAEMRDPLIEAIHESGAWSMTMSRNTCTRCRERLLYFDCCRVEVVFITSDVKTERPSTVHLGPG